MYNNEFFKACPMKAYFNKLYIMDDMYVKNRYTLRIFAIWKHHTKFYLHKIEL